MGNGDKRFVVCGWVLCSVGWLVGYCKVRGFGGKRGGEVVETRSDSVGLVGMCVSKVFVNDGAGCFVCF